MPNESTTAKRELTYQLTAIDALRPNALNPRGEIDGVDLEDLAASIRAQGVLQPLLATPDGTVVAGHQLITAEREKCPLNAPGGDR